MPRKMVSLGAAANYAGTQSVNKPIAKTEPSSNFDLLGGLDAPVKSELTTTTENKADNWDPFSGATTAAAPQETKKVESQNWDPFSGNQNEQPQPKNDDPFGKLVFTKSCSFF